MTTMARHHAKKKTPSAPQVASVQGVKGKNGNDRIPRSMVIRMGAGDVGSSVSQLVKDIRLMMEPHTASRLKVGNTTIREISCLILSLTRSVGRTGYVITLPWQGRSGSPTCYCSHGQNRET